MRDGVLVGYQLDRTFAPRLGLDRSNGCAFADSPHHVPIQRMANVSLQPDPARDTSTEELIAGVDRGIYVVGDKSWSIDMQRYNFQFTGQRFYRDRERRSWPGSCATSPTRPPPPTSGARWTRVGGAVDLGAARRDELREGPARADRGGEPRLPVGPVPRGQRAQHAEEGR